tara:strand:- start:44841 stop:45539 length:699 start_codon:yes stop_codon:yes gene_type:complete
MRRFFVEIPSLNIEELVLPPEESRHACKVLRMSQGDEMEVVNGNGELFTGRISIADTKKCQLSKLNYSQFDRDQFEIHIAIAPTKMNDRFETFLEKATELGVHRITPLLCSNSERKKIKLDRYNKVLVAAMKQSKRLFLPHLDELTSYSDFISEHSSGLIAHCEETAKEGLTNVLKPSSCPILIGPEGDFTPAEIELALKNGYKPVSLGKTRLRTETAGLYACSLAKFKLEE